MQRITPSFVVAASIATLCSGPVRAQFAPEALIGTVQYANRIAIADLDEDGDLDVATAAWSNKVVLHVNNNNGTSWTPYVIFTPNFGFAVDTADLDLDGDIDLLIGATGDGVVTFLENINGSSSWLPHVIDGLGGRPYSVTSGDIDQDGLTDIVACFGYGDGSIVWHRNLGAGAFSGRNYVAYTYDPWEIAVGDLDGDSDLDMVTRASDEWGALLYYENEGSGAFAPPDTIMYGSVDGEALLQLADLDADLDLDVVFALPGDLLGWLANNGDGTFAEAVGVSGAGAGPNRAADLDGDGDMDLLSGDNGAIHWYENDGAGNFGPLQMVGNYDVGGSPEAIMTGDLDNDGDEDVVIASNYNDEVNWYRNMNLQTGVAFVPSVETTLQVAPNPMFDHTILRAGQPIASDGRIELVDCQGRIMLSRRGDGSSTVRIERGTLAAGYYTLRIIEPLHAQRCMAVVLE